MLPLVAAIERTQSHQRVCIGSFCSGRAARLRAVAGDRVCTWLGRAEVARLRLASFGMPVPRFRGSCMQIPVRKGPMMLIDRRLLDPPAVEGVAVHAWTIDDRPEMERLLDLGVDGIISNRPTLLKQVFSERGLWVGA